MIFEKSIKIFKIIVDLDLAGYENMDIWSHE